MDRGYSPLPLFHVNAQVVGILSTFVAGGSLVVDDRFHASRFWAAAEDFQVTWLNLVPAILGILGEGAPPAEAAAWRVRFARSASAPLPPAVLDRFEATSGIGVLETYGMTEAASQITANPLLRSRRRPGSAGRPTGVAVRIVGAHDGELPPGETGAVEIRGAQVIGAYLGPGRRPIQARGADGWLRTGDLGFRDSADFLYLAGRSDDVINRGGEKVHPLEIEEVLLSDPHIRGAAVVGRPHHLLGEECVAYVVTDPGYTGSSPDRLAGQLLDAHSLGVLGGHAAAAAGFRAAIDRLRPGYHRDRGVYLARESVAYAGAGEPEHAAGLEMQALRIGTDTLSARILVNWEPSTAWISRTNQQARAEIEDLGGRVRVLSIPELLVLKGDAIPKLEQAARAVPRRADDVGVYDSGEGWVRYRVVKKVERKRETFSDKACR